MIQLDSKSLKLMIASASNQILNNVEKVNDMNVFPVPDGDTGTNMSMTFSAAAKSVVDLCNKHYGQRMLLITYEISKKLYPNKPLYLEVRTWNIRAVKCYQKAGFRIDGQAYELTTGIGTGTFYRMIRE